MILRKNHLFLLLALFGIGVMTRYVFRDINLDLDLLRESLENMPVVVMENLEFEREISGELWQVRVPLAERRDEMVEVRSVDVRRRLADGKEWFFLGSRGVYSEAAESADLTRLLGTLETDARVLNLESPGLSWTRSENVFLFPMGLSIYDAEFILETDLASLDASGVMALDKGAVVRWKKLTSESE